jgi:microcystin-dependent protein
MSDALDEKTRAIASALSANPMDLIQGQLKGYIEDFIRITVGGGSSNGSGSSGVSAAYYVPGDVKVTLADLTAQTSEYVFEDESGQWLYCNGVAVSQTTYADLYAAVGANAFGTDSGGNFFLPDPRGRALFFTGTHTDADLGDNDGVALASRTAKHSHTLSLAADSHTHTYLDPLANVVNLQAGATPISFPDGVATDPTGSSAPAVSGTVGTGTPVDTPAHLFIGSLLVRF